MIRIERRTAVPACLIADLIGESHTGTARRAARRHRRIISALSKVVAEMTYGSDAEVRRRV
jgi:hypothetical protein